MKERRTVELEQRGNGNGDAAALRFGDKSAVAKMAGGNSPFSKRWVDDQMAKGMPHLKLGSRRVRFDLAEVAAWLKEKYGQQRIGPLHTQGTTAASQKPQ